MVLKNKDKVRITSGDVNLSGFTVQEDGQLYEPEAISVIKGPYKIHMAVVSTPSEFTVQQIKVESRRPAILGPEKFADIQSIKLDGINNINQLRAI